MTLSIKHAFVCGIADDPADLAAGKVTPSRWNAELSATMAGPAVLGRASGSGAVEEGPVSAPLTFSGGALAVQQFGAGQSGFVPASGGGTTNFLRADGTWAAPSGGGGGSPGGNSGEVQYNNAGAFAGAAQR